MLHLMLQLLWLHVLVNSHSAITTSNRALKHSMCAAWNKELIGQGGCKVLCAQCDARCCSHACPPLLLLWWWEDKHSCSPHAPAAGRKVTAHCWRPLRWMARNMKNAFARTAHESPPWPLALAEGSFIGLAFLCGSTETSLYRNCIWKCLSVWR